MFRNANPSNLRGTPCEVNKDHLLNQEKQSWRSKSFMSSTKRKSKDWPYRTLDTDMLNFDENNYSDKKNYL